MVFIYSIWNRNILGKIIIICQISRYADFKNFLLGYKKADENKEIMLRFEKVEERGRYKGKG